ncbi:MAG: hypothetical protein HKP61_11210, partial [Dactylosporangium sp.]|nr:hypothetical protein [Dactylosporangium sp.]
MPSQPYDLLIDAARDLPRTASAYDAELLASTLLGSLYAVAEPPRAQAVERFVT